MNDPFRLNDWEIKNFLTVISFMQLTILSTICLSIVGLDIPIIRQIVGFVYLTFVPGITLLRVFRLHSLGRIETLLYSVGLSIAFLMILGFLMNALYPFIAISTPISIVPLTITVSAAVFVLCTLAYMRDKDFSGNSFFDAKEILSPTTLALCLLPLLSIFGTYFMNFLDNNTLLLILLLMISIMPILAMFDRFPRKEYPLAVFVIALSLLYHASLISMYIVGWDIQIEYYLSNLVKVNSYWVSSLPSSFNAMLSIVMVAPIFSIISNLDLVWVFKIIYPIFFSLVPLGLYRVFWKQTNEKIAFLSCFFFMSIFTFYTEMPQLARQQIAELFLVLLMLLMFDKTIKGTKKTVFSAIFAFSLITSHYGLSYIFMFSLIIVWGFLQLRKLQQSGKGIANSNAFVFLYCVLALTWYIYISSSSTFTQVVKIGGNIVENISEFANPNSVQALSLVTVTRTPSLLYQVTKGLYLLVEFFISVGILALFLRRTEMRPEREYAIFSAVNFALLLGGITVPNLASALNTQRFFHLTLLFLAPFGIVGANMVWSALNKISRTSLGSKIDFLKVLSLFFAVFLLFSSGFVYQVTNDHPSSISLNNSIDAVRFNEKEVITVKWLKDRANSSIPVYADEFRAVLLHGILWEWEHPFFEATTPTPRSAYFFLGYENVENGKIIILNRTVASTIYLQNSSLYDTLYMSNKIYDNNGAEVYITSGN